jgi:ABC-type Fe3+ transport system substrate-binding protein
MTKEQIAEALKAEGQVVNIKSWGFGGLDKDQFPQRFKEFTQATYAVPVELIWDSDNAVVEQHEQAGTPLGESVDVFDKEEDYYPKAREFDWIEPINDPKYDNILTNWKSVEPAYIKDDGLGVIYQGFEWLGIAARKDKFDTSTIKDWTDLAAPQFKGKIVSHPLNEVRGQLIFVGILNSLIKQGIVKGDLWSEQTWIDGLKWYKANIEPNILKYADTDEMSTMMQSGEAWLALTWGSYVREMQGSEWNLRDNVIEPIYPASGLAGDRETITALKGAKHPVTARVLIDWMLSPDFLMAGWYKDPATGKESNRWNLSESQFLTAYAGGINADQRKLVPEWSKAYYPDDPAKLTVPVDFNWLSQHVEWVWNQYQGM